MESGSPALHPIPRNTQSQSPPTIRIIKLLTVPEILDEERRRNWASPRYHRAALHICGSGV